MKFSGRKVIALIIALMMCSTVVSAFADGPEIEITKVEVLDNAGDVEFVYQGVEIGTAEIHLTAEQMLRVTATVTGAGEDAQISFMSYQAPGEDAASYTDETIQYLNQETPDSSGVAVFTFRPRRFANTFVAMTGAEGVSEADSFTYTVGVSLPNLSITATDANAESGREDDKVAATIASSDSILPTADALSVYIDYVDEQSEALAKDGTAYSYDEITGVIEILNAAVGSVGNHTVTVSAEGYNMPASPANYIVTEPVESPLEGEEEEKAAQDAVNEITHTVVKEDGYQKISMADTEITIGESGDKTVAVKHTFDYDNNDGALTVQDGMLVYDESARTKFASKVTITSAVVGDDDVSKTETVYFIPDDVQISFGNLTAIAKSDDQMADAFTSTESIAAISAQDKGDALTIALNVTMGRGTFDDVVRATDTIDYVKDGKFVLAEYRIIKLLMDGTYTYEEVNSVRDNWQPQP